MKRILVPLGLLPLLLIGVGAAVALSPGEHVACATATVPAQTIAANGTAIGTIPGAGSVACTTATDQTVTSNVTTTVPGPTTTVTTVAPPPSGLIADEGTVRLGGTPPNMTNGDKFSLLGLGSYYNLFQPLPGKTIKYTSGMQVFADDVAAGPATARANGWLLHNANGQEVLYDGNLLVDPSNVSFQNDLKQRLSNFLAAHPWVDGFYFDNFECDARNFGAGYPLYASTPGGGQGPLLWSDKFAFRNAQISFISNVGAYFKSRGYFVAVNGGCYDRDTNDTNTGLATEQWVGRYKDFVTAVMAESWQKRSFDYSPDGYWTGNEHIAAYVQSQGLGFIPADYVSSTDLRQTRFYRGCYLLDWNGVKLADTNAGAGAMLFAPPTTADNWNPEMAKNLGQPTGPKVKVWSGDSWGSGVWRRDFTNGYVIVNPTGSSVTVGAETIPAIDAVLHQN